ncbi:hypothetical protein VCEM1626_002974B, partial [Vibrio cholerae O1 str. EM-1626]
SPHEHR